MDAYLTLKTKLQAAVLLSENPEWTPGGGNDPENAHLDADYLIVAVVHNLADGNITGNQAKELASIFDSVKKYYS